MSGFAFIGRVAILTQPALGRLFRARWLAASRLLQAGHGVHTRSSFARLSVADYRCNVVEDQLVLQAFRTRYSELQVTSIQQPSGLYFQRLRKLLHHRHCGIALSTLDIADIGAVNASTVSIVLLAPAFLLAKATNIPAKARAYIHAGLMTPV